MAGLLLPDPGNGCVHCPAELDMFYELQNQRLQLQGMIDEAAA